jgi:hypothetical protein
MIPNDTKRQKVYDCLRKLTVTASPVHGVLRMKTW